MKGGSTVLITGHSIHVAFVQGPIYIKLFLKETFCLMPTVSSVRPSTAQVAVWNPAGVMGLGVCVVEWLDLGKETAAVWEDFLEKVGFHGLL